MVLNNVTKFHKTLIKTIRLRAEVLGVTYGWTDAPNYAECVDHCPDGGIINLNILTIAVFLAKVSKQ